MIHYITLVHHSKLAIISYRAKLSALEKVLTTVKFSQCIVFTNLRTLVETICCDLRKLGFTTSFISGDRDQHARLRAIDNLKRFRCKVFVSSDVVSRGIDAENVDLVINFDQPLFEENFFHRCGRAGRYGSKCVSITFVNEDEVDKFKSIFRENKNIELYILPDTIPKNLIAIRPLEQNPNMIKDASDYEEEDNTKKNKKSEINRDQADTNLHHQSSTTPSELELPSNNKKVPEMLFDKKQAYPVQSIDEASFKDFKAVLAQDDAKESKKSEINGDQADTNLDEYSSTQAPELELPSSYKPEMLLNKKTDDCSDSNDSTSSENKLQSPLNNGDQSFANHIFKQNVALKSTPKKNSDSSSSSSSDSKIENLHIFNFSTGQNPVSRSSRSEEDSDCSGSQKLRMKNRVSSSSGSEDSFCLSSQKLRVKNRVSSSSGSEKDHVCFFKSQKLRSKVYRASDKYNPKKFCDNKIECQRFKTLSKQDTGASRQGVRNRAHPKNNKTLIKNESSPYFLESKIPNISRRDKNKSVFNPYAHQHHEYFPTYGTYQIPAYSNHQSPCYTCCAHNYSCCNNMPEDFYNIFLKQWEFIQNYCYPKHQ